MSAKQTERVSLCCLKVPALVGIALSEKLLDRDLMTLLALKAMVTQLQSENTELRARIAELEVTNIYMTDHVRFTNEQSRMILNNMLSTKKSLQQAAQVPSFLSNKSVSSASIKTEPDSNSLSTFDELVVLNEKLHESRMAMLSKERELSAASSLISAIRMDIENVIETLPVNDPAATRLTSILNRMQS